jgi:hypothetical protein
MATSVGDTELGCGQYDVFFMTRCGGNYVCKADGVTDIAFTRKLNDTSTAEITVAIGDVSNGCCECLASINPWQHEIIIFRNGVSVWAGPIVDIEFDLSSETAKFRARDLSAWLDRRVIELTVQQLACLLLDTILDTAPGTVGADLIRTLVPRYVPWHVRGSTTRW